MDTASIHCIGVSFNNFVDVELLYPNALVTVD